VNEAITMALFIASFVTIIFLIANRKNFGIAMIIGSLLLSIANVNKIGEVFLNTITDFRVIALMIIVVLIKMLATILEDSGLIKNLITGMEKKLSSRGMLIAIPSILGLLPVPGGALLSAPIVYEQGKKVGMSSEKMMVVNLWYRHIGFLVFPLSTSLILISELSNINIYKLIILQSPIFLLSFFVGYVFIYKYKNNKMEGNDSGNLKGLIPIILPISIAIPLSFVISIYASYLIALPAGIIAAVLMSKKKISFFKGASLSLALAIFGIMFFKNIIIAMGIPRILPEYLNFLQPIILIPLLSFFIGIITAHNLAAVGILYPMFSSIMNEQLVIILFISSFMGYLVSPLHLCIAVTYEYFKPKFAGFYRLILPPSLLILIATIIIYGILV